MRSINILDSSFKKLAVLQNAKSIQPKTTLNGVGELTFEIPYDDPKRQFITPFAYVELVQNGAREDLYRVLIDDKDVGNDGGMLKIQCEHVLATLLDDPMPGWNIYGGPGIYTRAAINFILGFQIVPHWKLGDCEYADQYEYGWQHEKCLPALNSILACMDAPRLDYDVSKYPWTIHIRKINLQVEPSFRAVWKHNMLGIQKRKDSNSLVNRMYAYGYGEGINQLSIRGVNGGLDFIENAASIAKYGIKAGYFVAREIEDAATLLASAKETLKHSAEPRITYTITGADVYQSTGSEIDRPAVGKVAKVYDEQDGEFITFITEVVGDSEGGEVQFSLSNVPDDVANAIASIADRQRIEQTYAQGATQIYAQSIRENANTSNAATLNFLVPDEMRVINKMLLKVRLDSFRSYSRTTSSGGGSSQTSSSGGGSTQTTSTDSQKSATSSSGGSQSITTAATEYFTAAPQNDYSDYVDRIDSTSGGTTQDTYTTYETGSGSHRHRVLQHYHTYAGLLSHRHGLGGHKHAMVHQHSFSVSAHTHTVTIPAHAHSVTVPSHSHSVNIPNHSHNIEQGIFTQGSPSGATLRIGGVVRAIITGREAELNITEWLLNSSGQIPRGSWLKVEIIPNDMAYVSMDVFVQGFVQSRGGGNY